MSLSNHPCIPTLRRAVGLACFMAFATACDDAPLEFVEEDETVELDAAASDTASDTAAEAAPANEAQDLEIGGVGTFANSSNTLGDCTWRRRQTTTSDTLRVPCASGEAPISGGCYSNYSSNHITRSHPYEAGSQTNLPENGESWWSVSSTNGRGWRCKSTQSSHLRGVALCCG